MVPGSTGPRPGSRAVVVGDEDGAGGREGPGCEAAARVGGCAGDVAVPGRRSGPAEGTSWALAGGETERASWRSSRPPSTLDASLPSPPSSPRRTSTAARAHTDSTCCASARTAHPTPPRTATQRAPSSLRLNPPRKPSLLRRQQSRATSSSTEATSSSASPATRPPFTRVRPRLALPLPLPPPGPRSSRISALLAGIAEAHNSHALTLKKLSHPSTTPIATPFPEASLFIPLPASSTSSPASPGAHDAAMSLGGTGSEGWQQILQEARDTNLRTAEAHQELARRITKDVVGPLLRCRVDLKQHLQLMEKDLGKHVDAVQKERCVPSRSCLFVPQPQTLTLVPSRPQRLGRAAPRPPLDLAHPVVAPALGPVARPARGSGPPAGPARGPAAPPGRARERPPRRRQAVERAHRGQGARHIRRDQAVLGRVGAGQVRRRPSLPSQSRLPSSSS